MPGARRHYDMTTIAQQIKADLIELEARFLASIKKQQVNNAELSAEEKHLAEMVRGKAFTEMVHGKAHAVAPDDAAEPLGLL